MVEASASVKKDERAPGKLALFLRLTRFQFIPLIILPGIVGTALAFSDSRRIDFAFFGLVILGIVALHLGANAIDDSYDYENGVDQIANSMFPRNFGGWKPIPRGYLSLKAAKIISLALFAISLLIGAYFGFAVGPWAFLLGLGEIAIFFSFGPIPVLGAYYVQTGVLSLHALLVSVPIGLMTVTILIYHDLIFYEVYSKARKYSLATVLGRGNALRASLGLTAVSFTMVIGLVLAHSLPIWSLLAPIISGIILLRKRSTYFEPNQPPPFYLSFTVNGLMANWLFALSLALTILI